MEVRRELVRKNVQIRFDQGVPEREIRRLIMVLVRPNLSKRRRTQRL